MSAAEFWVNWVTMIPRPLTDEEIESAEKVRPLFPLFWAFAEAYHAHASQQAAPMSSEFPWTIETIRIINDLTPAITGKAFDVEWFLLRQRFEQIEGRLAQYVENKRVGDCCDCGGSIWFREARITDESGTYHPMCRVQKQKKELEHRLAKFEQAAPGPGPRCPKCGSTDVQMGVFRASAAKQTLLIACEQCGQNMGSVNAEEGMYKLSDFAQFFPAQGHWISVSDRLPEDGIGVLVWKDFGLEADDNDQAQWDVGWVDYDKRPSVWVVAGETVNNITHWQALPAPPEQKGGK